MATLPVKAQTKTESADDIVTGSIARHERPEPSELSTANTAMTLYRANRISEGDAIAATLTDPILKRTAEWAAIRSAQQSLGFGRLQRFARANPDFPGKAYLERRMENAQFADRAAAGPSFDFYSYRDPGMAAGNLLLALHLRDKGYVELAKRQIRRAWREQDFSRDIETAILRDFGDALGEEDHFYRAQKLIYSGQTGLGFSAALRLSPDHAALMVQLAGALASRGSVRSFIDRVPPGMRKEPAFALMRAIELRRLDRHVDAADLLLDATRDPDRIVGGDKWWHEERALARGLMDAKEYRLAYRIAAGARAISAPARSEAEFLSGFIALRLLKEPSTADMHFLRSLEAATDPTSKARAHYWLGRAREELFLPSRGQFEAAAVHSANYYGQIAAAHIGHPLVFAHARADKKQKADILRRPVTRVLDALLEMEQIELATTYAQELAASFSTAEEVDVVAELLAKARKPKLTLSLGRRNFARGLALVDTAFPVSGIPPFAPAAGSAELPLVFAVARQESAFDPRAVSRADARGLMQMLPSTARVTARRFGIPFAPADLLDNPALNAKLGAAHLGELTDATRGNIPMMLAAYNAGPSQMRKWLAAYGDPRSPDVDPIDWVERIPFNETRGYIQKVTENLQVYRARLDPSNRRTILDDLKQGRRALQEAALP